MVLPKRKDKKMMHCTNCEDVIWEDGSSVLYIDDEAFCNECFEKAEAKAQSLMDEGR